MSEDTEEVYANFLSDTDKVSDVESSDSNDNGSDSETDTELKYDGRLQSTIIRDSDEEDNDLNEDETEWTLDSSVPKLPIFTGQPGIQVPHTDLNSVKSCLDLIIGEELLNIFVTETNRYYHQNENISQSKKKTWTDTDIKEMKKFLGLIIIMGFVKKSDKDDYWSTNPLICTPIFANTMSRNRFRQIWRHWHFNNNENCQSKLDKIIPIVENLTRTFQTVYKPERELFLHENVIPWHGKLPTHTYSPIKTVKRGILMHTVYEAVSGYICNFEICSTEEKPLNTKILSVLFPFLNVWHDVYTNSYYNSTETAEELLKHDTNICGIIRKNKGIPSSLKNIDLMENETEFRRKHNLLVQAWKAKKNILFMMSTMHHADLVQVVDTKREEPAMKPTCVTKYETHITNVHRVNKYLSYYSVLQKTKKWTKKITLHLLNCALFNAYQIYVKSSGNNMKYKKFLLAVANVWISPSTKVDESEPSTSIACGTRAAKYDPVDRLCPQMKKHSIIKIIGQGKLKACRRACRVCTAAKKRSSTAYMCSSCVVPLHAGKCFETYHTQRNYSNK